MVPEPETETEPAPGLEPGAAEIVPELAEDLSEPLSLVRREGRGPGPVPEKVAAETLEPP